MNKELVDFQSKKSLSNKMRRDNDKLARSYEYNTHHITNVTHENENKGIGLSQLHRHSYIQPNHY